MNIERNKKPNWTIDDISELNWDIGSVDISVNQLWNLLETEDFHKGNEQYRFKYENVKKEYDYKYKQLEYQYDERMSKTSKMNKHIRGQLTLLSAENDILREEIKQLHQAIAGLNDKPTNSL